MPRKPIAQSPLSREIFALVTGRSFEDGYGDGDGIAGEGSRTMNEPESGTDVEQPPKKRPRTRKKRSKSRAGISDGEKMTQVIEGLERLPTLPLDILYGIFDFLDPKDIVILAQTNKFFRETLLVPNAICVWKAARRRYDAPEPPRNVSEIAWAILLFGDTCQNCGARNVARADFMLRRRLCNKCKKTHLFAGRYFRKRYPGRDKSILALVPFTEYGAHHIFPSRSRFFWNTEVDRVIQKLEEYENNIHIGLPDAKEVLKFFKEQQISRMRELQSTEYLYHVWQSHLIANRERRLKQLQLMTEDN